MADTESYALQKLTKAVWEELNHRGYCVVDKFHTEEKALAILNEAKSMHAKGEMHNGQLASTLTSKSIRGDLVKWVDGKAKGTEVIALHMRRTDALLRQLNNMISYRTIQEELKQWWHVILAQKQDTENMLIIQIKMADV